MKNLTLFGLLLIAFQIHGQEKAEALKNKIVGVWKFEKVKLVDQDKLDNANLWGIDTVEFRYDKTLTFYSREFSYNKVTRYDKLTGTWELKSDLKKLLITIQGGTVEMTFKLKGNNSIQINHPVRVGLAPNLPKNHPNFKTGLMEAKVIYKKIGG